VRKVFLKVHLYLGLTVGLLFALMGLTGSLLVFSEEIDRAANPHLLTVQQAGEHADFALIEAAVKTRFPNDKIYRIKMPHNSGDVYEFWMNGGEALRVYVDPYSASVLGSRDYPQTWRGRLFMLHTQLLSGETGKTIIGTAAFFFLAIGISGIILWWRGKRHIRRGLTINFRSGWKRANFDIHHAVGFFAFFFLTISAVSGIYLIFNAPFEKTVNQLTGTPDRLPAPASKIPNGSVLLSLDDIFERSEKIWPEAETTWLYPPANPNAAYMVRKKFPAENHPNGKSFIYFDQYTGEVLRTENATESPVPTKAVNDLYPLHIGRMGGTITRVLQVFIGLLPTTLLITGFLMWRNKQRRKR
jgi:uncharacterized iron-regulated membrane protein